jgi:hypothetical protein
MHPPGPPCTASDVDQTGTAAAVVQLLQWLLVAGDQGNAGAFAPPHTSTPYCACM